MRLRTVGVLSCIVIAGLSTREWTAGTPAEDPGTNEAEESPEAYAERVRGRFARLDESRSLLWDWMTIEQLAGVPNVDVVPTLLDELRKTPPKGLENRSFLLASAIAYRAASRRVSAGAHLLDSEAKALLKFVEKELRHPIQSWTAFNAALALADRPVEGLELETLLLDASRPATIRAAILLGLAEGGQASLLESVQPLLEAAAAMRSREDRDRLREAVVWATARLCAPVLSPDDRSGTRNGRPNTDEGGEEEEEGRSVLDIWGIPKTARRRSDSPASSADRATPGSSAGTRQTALRCLQAIQNLLDDESIGSRTRLQVMRALQHAWGTEVAYESAESWRQVAADRERKAQGEDTRTSVRFFGIPSSGGHRVLFLLDGSDSMLTPLTPEEKDALWALLKESVDAELAGGPTAEASASTPKTSSRGRTGVRSRSRSGLSPIDDAAWEAVATRFDAARAHLQHTLASMSPDVELAVILFGSEAETLRSTPLFVKATEANRVRVALELDSIVPGPKDATHPNGTLRGETNIYEAFQLGLSLEAGRAPGRTHVATRVVDPRLVDGCADTVYLLTDGMPTRDGFRGRTPVIETQGQWTPEIPAMEGEREVLINPETGATRKVKYKTPARPRTYSPGFKTSSLDTTGPYIFQEPLTEEVRRRNLFVKAKVHVVAIGEAGTWLGSSLARAGGGRCLRISSSGQREDL